MEHFKRKKLNVFGASGVVAFNLTNFSDQNFTFQIQLLFIDPMDTGGVQDLHQAIWSVNQEKITASRRFKITNFKQNVSKLKAYVKKCSKSTLEKNCKICSILTCIESNIDMFAYPSSVTSPPTIRYLQQLNKRCSTPYPLDFSDGTKDLFCMGKT